MFQRLAPLARSALLRPTLASPLLRPSASALRCNAPTIARFAQPRCFLSTEAAAEPKPVEDERPKLVYEGAKNKIVGTLKEIGYDGALTNEFVAPVDRTPAAIYPDMVETDPVDISPEQLQFIQDHGSSLLTEKFYADQMRITAETLLPLMK